MSVLDKDFFDRSVLRVAPDLLGKVLMCGGTKGVITEVEAYDGPDDRACHASKGKTLRTKVMFGPAGYWYVYLCYGMHWMLNIVCEKKGYPAAVLIRGVLPCNSPCCVTPSAQHPLSLDTILLRKITRDDTKGAGRIEGPGRVTKYFGVDKRFNEQLVAREFGLWIEDHGIVVPKNMIKRTPRIGVAYAGVWAAKPYRFICPTLVGGRQ